MRVFSPHARGSDEPLRPARTVAAPPTVAALLTCAAIHQDDTRKAYLLGIFNGYQAAAFPAMMPRLCLYLALTDGHGPTVLVVRLIDAADEFAPPLFTFDIPPVRFGSPLDVKEVAVEVPAVTLPRPGLFRWQGCVPARCCTNGDSPQRGSAGNR